MILKHPSMMNYYRMMKNHYEAIWTRINSYNKSKHKILMWVKLYKIHIYMDKDKKVILQNKTLQCNYSCIYSLIQQSCFKKSIPKMHRQKCKSHIYKDIYCDLIYNKTRINSNVQKREDLNKLWDIHKL